MICCRANPNWEHPALGAEHLLAKKGLLFLRELLLGAKAGLGLPAVPVRLTWCGKPRDAVDAADSSWHLW